MKNPSASGRAWFFQCPALMPSSAEDLRDTKERLSSEIEGLNRQLARKERLQDEALARARAAEASLSEAQKELAELRSTVKSRMKELEASARRADEVKAKTEREYTALRDGLRCVLRSLCPAS